jgi:hypothetical protein
MRAADSVRIALHRYWPVSDVREYVAGDVFVEVDDLALGEAGLGIHDFIEIR